MFNKSIFTANQIASIVRAVGAIHPNILEEYEANQKVGADDERQTTVDLLRDTNVFKLIDEQKEKELTGLLLFTLSFFCAPGSRLFFFYKSPIFLVQFPHKPLEIAYRGK